MRFVAAVVSALLVVTGCATSSYQIPRGELERLAATPPEQRANRVLVSQELSATDVQSAQPVYTETEVVWIPDTRRDCCYGSGGGGGSWGHWSSGGGSGGGRVSTGGGGGGGIKGGGAS